MLNHPVFVDAAFWIARLNPRDAYHSEAAVLRTKHSQRPWITSDMVLAEVAACFSKSGLRARVADWLGEIIDQNEGDVEGSATVAIIYTSAAHFRSGLKLYTNRPDKTYSLTDCTSMVLMHALKLTEVLTCDRHFEQEGLTTLMTLA